MLTPLKVSSKSTFENGESKEEFLQLLWWKLEQAWRRQGLAQLGDCGQESQQCWLGVGVEGGLGQQNIQEEQVCVQTEASSNTGECLCEKMLIILDLHGISLSVWICLPLELFSKWMILSRCSWIYVNDEKNTENCLLPVHWWPIELCNSRLVWSKWSIQVDSQQFLSVTMIVIIIVMLILSFLNIVIIVIIVIQMKWIPNVPFKLAH